MIRRELSLPGRDKAWALISQVEHARLSANLARRWRGPLVPARGRPNAGDLLHGELIGAIEHHDDGWAEWEEAPELHPEHGWPRSFMEMPQPDALAIWSKSIAVAEQIGPLAAWVVAGHFAALLKVGDDTRSDEARLAREWSELMQSRRAAWLQDWMRADAELTQESAEDALRALQFFDAASLWVCCTCPPESAATPAETEDAVLAFADGKDYRFTSSVPHAAAGSGSPLGSIRPWPLEVDEVSLSVACSVAPIGNYQATDELLLASEPRRISWRLGREARS